MIYGVSMVKDEADIIADTIANLIDQGVSRFLILDNNSTDETPEILAGFPQVEVIPDPEVGYYQSRKITDLACRAAREGATWVVPFDADEHWYGVDGWLSDVFAAQPDEVTVLGAQVWSQWGVYREEAPHALRKVAFRAHPNVQVAQGNHNVTRPGARVDGLIEIRERQYRSFEQFCRKVRHGKVAYDATNMHRQEGAHWRRYGAMSDDELRAEWLALSSVPKVLDPCP